MRWLLLVLAVCFPVLAAVDNTPPLPKPGEDSKLMEGESARKFFEARFKDTKCREELAKTDSKKDRKRWMELMAQCGRCLETVTKWTPPHPEEGLEDDRHWYVSDGSCQLEETDSDKLTKAYETMSASLVDIKQYPVKSGGFSHLLEFVQVDKEGKLLKPAVVTEPFLAFIAVYAGNFGIFKASGTYFISNKFETLKESKGPAFWLTFEGVKPPMKFKAPDVFAGKDKTVQKRISRVKGAWYVNSDGYLRYFTAADFRGIPVDVNLAHDILLDTLVQMSVRGAPLF